MAVIQTILWVWTTLEYQINYFFFYSNWGNTLTLLAFWMLALTHYKKATSRLHEFAITTFEIAITMEYVINPLYWFLIVELHLFNPWDIMTYQGPIFNHLFPFVILNLDMIINGFHFNYPKTLKPMVIVAIFYLLTNYAGSIHQDKPVYFFLNFQNPKTFFILGVIVVL